MTGVPLQEPRTPTTRPTLATGARRARAMLGVRFTDRSLLLASLAHRSWCAENEQSASNERLEFLGDSVLGLVVTHYVFEHFPDLPEGQLSEVRAGVVNARVLAEVAQEIDLGALSAARQGRRRRRRPGEAVDPRRRVRSGGRRRLPRHRPRDARATSCCAACATASPKRSPGPGGRDYKTRLQELAAARRRSVGPATSCATRGPTTPSTSSPPCSSATSATARARAARRSRPSKARRGSRGLACSKKRARQGGGDAGAT